MTAETNAERLEIIKQEGLVDALKFKLDVNDAANQRVFEDTEWLIQQAEQAQELADELTEWQTGQSMTSNHYNQIRNLSIENARLREALEFYADEDFYKGDYLYTKSDNIPVYNESAIDEDAGETARQALKGESE